GRVLLHDPLPARGVADRARDAPLAARVAGDPAEAAASATDVLGPRGGADDRLGRLADLDGARGGSLPASRPSAVRPVLRVLGADRPGADAGNRLDTPGRRDPAGAAGPALAASRDGRPAP